MYFAPITANGCLQIERETETINSRHRNSKMIFIDFYFETIHQSILRFIGSKKL